MKCKQCGYEAPMIEFKWVKNISSCCSITQMRECPRCHELSPCEPLAEEMRDEQNKLKRSEDESSFYFEL